MIFLEIMSGHDKLNLMPRQDMRDFALTTPRKPDDNCNFQIGVLNSFRRAEQSCITVAKQFLSQSMTSAKGNNNQGLQMDYKFLCLQEQVLPSVE